MAISFDRALGIHDDALRFRSQRSAVLANNLANMDTPNYKARDIDFKTALAKASAPSSSLHLAATNAAHQRGVGLLSDAGDAQYRIPTQPSIDGNTVEEHVEQANYTQNALDFQASFTFLNSKFKGLTSAIRGE